MKFQPQIVTCPICGRQHQIITEDIPSRNIYVCRKLVNPGLRLCVLLECPECYRRFELRFEEKSNFNNETMFECTGCMNAGLQMWKRIEGSSIITPSYQPNVGNRTALEQKLDGKALAKVNRIYPWQNQTDHAKTLADYLGEVDDYTKQIKWRQFKHGQLIVAYCAHDGKTKCYKGYNSLFNTVRVKNEVLSDEFVAKLGGADEDLPNHYCNNKIGHCAEMHAANSCLNAEPELDTNNLRFSIAYQCRTAEPRSYCLNCITLFQNVSNG